MRATHSGHQNATWCKARQCTVHIPDPADYTPGKYLRHRDFCTILFPGYCWDTGLCVPHAGISTGAGARKSKPVHGTTGTQSSFLYPIPRPMDMAGASTLLSLLLSLRNIQVYVSRSEQSPLLCCTIERRGERPNTIEPAAITSPVLCVTLGLPRLVQALLGGDLPVRIQDDTFKQDVGYLPLQNLQGVCIVYLAMIRQIRRRDEPDNPLATKNIGINMTLVQLLEVTESIKVYATLDDDSGRSRTNTSFCKRIGSQFTAAGCNNFEHPYGESRHVSATENRLILSAQTCPLAICDSWMQ
ncbi:hypothetical protein H2200_009479 [Cladophialophora chaetospira]|uniref:Uncharacterized protein n=1 Tax=Cladophialophora chaetospira TaxID=386627 RepID=A0AA39CEL5_9EURO|nr:hypothetical protein H2200_009479 [Cladophialophora chaetospira]